LNLRPSLIKGTIYLQCQGKFTSQPFTIKVFYGFNKECQLKKVWNVENSWFPRPILVERHLKLSELKVLVNFVQYKNTYTSHAYLWWLTGLVVWGPDYETKDSGFKSRQWVGVFVMYNYTCSQVMAVYIYYYQYNLYIRFM
jgi:hypothetical protein